ncbi:phosphodiesterase [Dongia rigui]|uniref:Phosphodiesterase n=1 Tax=Dongia rigui TaxID=940149 RepID=A0ABU5DY80_9PROT|nr:phosphodiesterase [Dongia rigui]MDY0871880.1 phosphodiesterase [Dongia rigui]
MLIAQISDPHVRPRGVLYHDIVDSNAMLMAAVRHLNTMTPRPDLVILSGDIVEKGEAAEYEVAREILAGIPMPLCVIPGNHDERDAFRAAFADHAYLPPSGPLSYTIGDRGPVRIVALDVTIPGAHHGIIDDERAAWLEQVLAAEPDRPTLIVMHQPPFDTGIPYMDPYACRNGARMAEIVARYPNVERIVCGHLHRAMQIRFGGTLLCTAPSTTTTIALQLDRAATDATYLEPPALLLHHWKGDTGLVTHHIMIGNYPGPYSFA